MSKGTILYAGAFELPDKNASANRVVSNGKIFRDLGYDVAFLGVTKDGEYFDGIRRADCLGFTVFEEAYPKTTGQWLMRVFSIENLNRAVAFLSDVRMIVLYNVPFAMLKRVRKHYRKSGIKIVYDCTEWNDCAEGNILKRKYKMLDEKKIESRLVSQADGLIVISRRMEKAYADCKNLLRLPPLVDTSDPIWRQERKRDDGRFEFCFAGELGGNKESMENVVRAFGELKDENCFLRVIGVEKDAFCVRYPDLSDICDNKKIIFMGRLSHEDTVGYVLGCDCYIFVRKSNNRNEAGFPTKFAEAATCGIPVITTDVSDIGEYIGKSVRGIILSDIGTDMIAGAIVNAVSEYGKSAGLSMLFDYRSYVAAAENWLGKVLK